MAKARKYLGSISGAIAEIIISGVIDDNSLEEAIKSKSEFNESEWEVVRFLMHCWRDDVNKVLGIESNSTIINFSIAKYGVGFYDKAMKSSNKVLTLAFFLACWGFRGDDLRRRELIAKHSKIKGINNIGKPPIIKFICLKPHVSILVALLISNLFI